MGGLWSIKFQVVVGFKALIKDRITGLDNAVRVIPKDDFRSYYLDDIFNLLIAEQKTNFSLRNN